MLARLAAAAAVLAAGVLAECPNACNGKGLCGPNDECICDAGYYGSDCTARLCPLGRAWADIPQGDMNHDGDRKASTYAKLSNGQGIKSNLPQSELFPVDAAQGGWAAKAEEGHFHIECSGVGSCDTSTGQCTCSAGFTGAACQRAKCPNDCSGNGRCRPLREVAAGALTRRATGSVAGNLKLTGVTTAFNYELWDADMHHQCVCDGGFSGPDCSERLCPLGTDPLVPSKPRFCGGSECAYEVQQLRLASAGPSTYRIAYTDMNNVTVVALATLDTVGNAPGFVPHPDTELAAPSTNAGIIMDALRRMPGSGLQQVEVSALSEQTGSALGRTFQVKFVAVPGDVYDLQVSVASGPGGVEVAPFEVVRGNMEATECASRGKCDRVTGQCLCFGGYSGGACELQNALAGSKSASK